MVLLLLLLLLLRGGQAVSRSLGPLLLLLRDGQAVSRSPGPLLLGWRHAVRVRDVCPRVYPTYSDRRPELVIGALDSSRHRSK